MLSQIAPHSVHPPQYWPSPRSLPFIVVTFFATCVSSLFITWPYNERRFWVTYVVIGLTIASLLNFSFLILPFCPESILAPSSRLGATFTALLCVAPNTHCHNYIKVGLMTVLYSLFFSLTGTFFSQITGTPDKSSTLIAICYRYLLHILQLLRL